jgi:hypothetical protein
LAEKRVFLYVPNDNLQTVGFLLANHSAVFDLVQQTKEFRQTTVVDPPIVTWSLMRRNACRALSCSNTSGRFCQSIIGVPGWSFCWFIAFLQSLMFYMYIKKSIIVQPQLHKRFALSKRRRHRE